MMRKFGIVTFLVISMMGHPQLVFALKWQLEKGKQEVKANKNTHREANHVQQMQHQ